MRDKDRCTDGHPLLARRKGDGPGSAIVAEGDELVRRRRFKLHDIIAGVQAGEGVCAGVIRGGRGNHRAGRVKQVHRDAGNDGLIRIPNAVPIGVVPDTPADGRSPDFRDKDAITDGQPLLARRKREGIRSAIVAEGDELVPRRRYEFHDILARGQAGEGVCAVLIRGGRANRRTGRVEQVHRDAGNAGLIRILDAVLVCVIPDVPPDTRRLDFRDKHAAVSYLPIFARHEGDGLGPAIRIEGDELVPRRRFKFHDIIARFQIGEGVCAVLIRRGRANRRTVRVEQVHGDAGNAGLIRILDAVLVRVIPDMTTQFRKSRRYHAGIGSPIVFACHQREYASCLSGRRVRIAVHEVVVALILQRESISRRQIKSHDIRLRCQTGKDIAAGIICGRRGNHRVSQIQQGHRDIGHARLIRILDAVRIGVVPDIPAKSRRQYE